MHVLVRDLISDRLRAAVADVQREGALPAFDVPASVLLERPQKPEHGDFASSLPLRVTKAAGRPPLEIAQAIAGAITLDGPIGEVFVAPPGFVNFRLSGDWLRAQVDAIRDAGDTFGCTDTGAGKRVQVEFVSVNPTGPVHVGHARGAVLGSALAQALEAAGFDVTREYYVNDAGTQMELFYRSAFARYAEALGRTDIPLPTDGYQGAYLTDLGKELAARHGSRFLEMEREAAVAELGEEGLNRMLDVIRTDLNRIGVEFDVWFRERSLFDDGLFDETMQFLRESGYTAEHDGAEWFTSTALGDEKDNVIVRSTGAPTYFASDIAYHRDKFVRRGYDRVINIWGADHQGHVPRMKAVMQALGLDPERLTILISQLVTLKFGGDLVRASKRSGNIITLGDLVDVVGADACRYFFLARAAESQMEFDLELARRASNENPVLLRAVRSCPNRGHTAAGERAGRYVGGRRRFAVGGRCGVGAGAQDAAAAGVGRRYRGDAGASLLAALRGGAGDGVPLVLRPLPCALRRACRCAADEGSAEAGGGCADGAVAYAGVDGDERTDDDVAFGSPLARSALTRCFASTSPRVRGEQTLVTPPKSHRPCAPTGSRDARFPAFAGTVGSFGARR